MASSTITTSLLAVYGLLILQLSSGRYDNLPNSHGHTHTYNLYVLCSKYLDNACRKVTSSLTLFHFVFIDCQVEGKQVTQNKVSYISTFLYHLQLYVNVLKYSQVQRT